MTTTALPMSGRPIAMSEAAHQFSGPTRRTLAEYAEELTRDPEQRRLREEARSGTNGQSELTRDDILRVIEEEKARG